MKRTAEVKLQIVYGSDFQEQVWQQIFENTLISLREMMEQKHKDNQLDWDTFTK